MKHPTSRRLHAYWDRLRGERSAPERGEIEPGAIRHLLADSLILELDAVHRSATIRLGGTRVCAVFGHELRGTSFAALWSSSERADQTWHLVETVATDMAALVAGVRGTTARGDVLDLELLLLPLRHRGRTHVRMLGSLSPHTTPHWIGSRPLDGIETLSVRVLGGVYATAHRLDPLPVPPAAMEALAVRHGHLTVLPGGRI